MAYIGKTPTVGNFQVCDAISVVNGQAAYTLQVGSANVIPQSANHMLVSLNGILQKPGSSFTVSGSTMTFASNLATGDVIDFVQILGNVLDIGQPSDGTVTSAKLNLTDKIEVTGASTNMRLNFDTNDTVANSTAIGGMMVKNNGDSVGQITVRRESAADDGYINFETQATGGSLTERVRIHSGGVMSATQGIALGVGTANTASNVLDDYEEGTWTPAYTGGTTAGTGVTGAGQYTKIGNLVHVDFGFVNVTASGAAGDLRITGLPFTVSNATTRGSFGGNVRFYSHDLRGNDYYQLTPVADGGTTYIVISESRDHGTWGQVQIDNDSGLYIEGGITYTTTA
jgi:hypothetical protein